MVESEDNKTPHVDIIIVTWNGRDFLETCLESLKQLRYPDYTIVVVDNGSTDGTGELLRQAYPYVQHIELEKNTGFCHANNVGISASKGTYVALLNNDTRVTSGWLSALVNALEDRPDYGFASSSMRQMKMPKTIDRVADAFSTAGFMWALGAHECIENYTRPMDIFAASAGAVLYRRSALDCAGTFDERYFAYIEDIDLSWRLQHAGYRGIYAPDAVVYHYGSGTSRGLKNPWVVRQTVRNLWLTMSKNIPVVTGIKMAPRILLYHLYWMFRFRCVIPYIRGWLSYIIREPMVYGDRWRILKNSKLSAHEIYRLLVQEDKKIFTHIRRRSYAEGRGEPRRLWRWLFLHGDTEIPEYNSDSHTQKRLKNNE